MNSFKDLVKEAYSEYEVDHLRAKNLENSILYSIEKIEKPKKRNYQWLATAASIVVITSTIYITQFSNIFRYEPTQEKLGLLAEELEQKPQLLGQTTLSLGSPDDIYYQKIKTADKAKIKKLLEEI